MDDLFFTALALAAVALVLGLPIVAWSTAAAARRELRALAERHEALARELRALKARGLGPPPEGLAGPEPDRTVGDAGTLADRAPPLEDAVEEPVRGAGAATPEAPRPLPTPAWARPDAPSAERRPTEEAIGMTWATRLGGALLLLGVLYFFRYVVQQGWLGPWGRIGLAAASGAGLIAAAEWLRARTQPLWVHAVTGVGVALLLTAAWASHSLYALVPLTAAFIAFAVIVFIGGSLAVRHQSQPLLITCVLAALANPLLLSSGQDRPAALFAYLLLVAAAASLVGTRRRWPWPPLLSALGTILLFGAWYGRWFSPDTTYANLGARAPTLAFVLAFAALFSATARASSPRAGALLLAAAALIGHFGAGLLLIDHSTLLAVAVNVLGVAFAALLVSAAQPARAVWPLGFGFITFAALSALVRERAAWIDASGAEQLARFTHAPLSLVATWAALWLAAACALRLRAPTARASGPLLALPAVAFAALLLLGTDDGAVATRTGGLLAAAAVLAALALAFHRQADRPASGLLATAALGLVALAVPVAFDGAAVSVAWAALAALVGVLGVRAGGRPMGRAAAALLTLAIAHALGQDFGAPERARDLYALSLGTEGAFHAPLLIGERGLALLGSGLAALLLSGAVRRVDPPLYRWVAGAGQILLAAWLVTEAWALLERGVPAPAPSASETAFADAWDGALQALRALGPARAVTTSVLIGLWGGALLSLGFFRRELYLRWLGLAFLSATLAKLLFVDVWDLARLYQTVILIALGALLLSSGFLYARFGDRLREVIRDE